MNQQRVAKEKMNNAIMPSLEGIDSQLEKLLTRERYRHSWQVAKLAEKIAGYYYISSRKAKITGLIHDCAKDYSFFKLKELVKQYQIQLDKVEKLIPAIWHAYVGAEIARDIFGIHDQEILNSIK